MNNERPSTEPPDEINIKEVDDTKEKKNSTVEFLSNKGQISEEFSKMNEKPNISNNTINGYNMQEVLPNINR